MPTVTGALDNILKEEISQGIREERNNIDIVWNEIISTSMGVESSGLGRSWQFKKAFVTGDAGAYEFMGTPTGNSFQASSYDYGILGTPQGFPSRTETTVPAFYLKTVTLKEARGNVFVPLKWHTLDKVDGSIGSAVKAVVTGMSRKVARAHALAFFTTDTTDFRIIDTIQASAAASSHTITIDNSSASAAHGRIQQLAPGMMVDIYNSSDAQQNSGPWVITQVNYLGQSFTVAKTVTGDANVALVASDYFTLRGSRNNQPSGLNTWIQDATATSVFGISFVEHPELSSLIETTTGPLTEKYLRNRIGAFVDRIGGMVSLDHILTPAGVVHAYMENTDNLFQLERMGKAIDYNEGWKGIGFMYHGKPFNWVISTFIQAGSLYVIKLGENNIKEYLPPKTPGMTTDGQFGDVEFVGPAGGLSGIWAHEHLVSLETSTPYAAESSIGDQLQAPFWRICELCPDQMQSIKTTGFDEA